MSIIRKATLLAALAVFTHSASANLTNGNFETGDLTGWNVATNGSANSIQVTSGETTTDAGTIPASLSGDFFVFTSQGGAGSSFLTQTFTVQPGQNRIFFDIAILNAAADFFVPDPISFDFAGPPNQQARFDILVPGASFDTENPADIIVTGFQTEPGDPLTLPWTSFDIDVTAELAPYVGQDVIFRFVQVDNQFFFNLAIDNVNVGITANPDEPSPATPIPTLPFYGLVLMALGLILVAAGRRGGLRKR